MTKELIEAPAINEAPPAPLINAEGQRIKTELIAKADVIQEIATVHIRDGAISVAADIKGHLTAIEKTRKEIKEPFLRMGQAIDDCAKKHVAELTIELNRLNRLVGAYNQEQADIARREQEARDRAAAEIARKAREEQEALERKLEEERKAALAAETKRKLAEAAAAAKGKELTAAQKAKQLEAQLAEQERLEKIEEEARERQAKLDREKAELEKQQLEAAERMRQEKATGGAQRTEIDIEVTDIHLLYASNRGCVRLTPDLVQIKFLINNSEDPNFRLPGVVYTKRAVFSAKGR